MSRRSASLHTIYSQYCAVNDYDASSVTDAEIGTHTEIGTCKEIERIKNERVKCICNVFCNVELTHETTEYEAGFIQYMTDDEIRI